MTSEHRAEVPGYAAQAAAPARVPTWQRRDPIEVDPIQYQAWCEEKLSALQGAPAEAAQVAAEGVAGPATALPHREAIQASFGQHDISGVQAHVGGPAAEASAAMGAHAYATGNQVAFASAPDLRLAAHEAAHVVQQREGVQLKGGVGQPGDPYEQHADAVADAVVRGESAERLLSSMSGPAAGPSHSVQLQAAGQVAVSVEWSSPFGSDLTGTVRLEGSDDNKSWVDLGQQSVTAANNTVFATVAWHKHYRATIQPFDDVPGDRDTVGQFKKTVLTSPVVPASATQATVRGGLELNRWNPDNVGQRHARRDIDPDKADDIHAQPLFGRVVNVHDLIAPRVAATDALYWQLPEPTRREIDASIFVTGAFAYRNRGGKAGAFSNHSIAAAIDVNYNEGKLQNALMDERDELALLNKLVEPVVKTDPALAGFKIWQSTGQDQLAASKAFNERFPMFLADLLGRDAELAELQANQSMVEATEGLPLGMGAAATAIRSQTVQELFATVTPAALRQAAKQQPNATKKAQLLLIATNWDALQAWVLGTPVTDHHEGQRDANNRKLPPERKVAVGMIPLHETVLQMFLDTGWSWGGDWKGTKDYMHFEDPNLEGQLKKP